MAPISWETLAAAQKMATQMGVPPVAAVIGEARELASKRLERAYAVEHPCCGTTRRMATPSRCDNSSRRSSRSWFCFRTPTRSATSPQTGHRAGARVGQ